MKGKCAFYSVTLSIGTTLAWPAGNTSSCCSAYTLKFCTSYRSVVKLAENILCLYTLTGTSSCTSGLEKTSRFLETLFLLNWCNNFTCFLQIPIAFAIQKFYYAMERRPESAWGQNQCRETTSKAASNNFCCVVNVRKNIHLHAYALTI